MEIKSNDALKTIYSPSHAVTIDHKNDHYVHLSYDGTDVDPDDDFLCYYSVMRLHHPWCNFWISETGVQVRQLLWQAFVPALFSCVQENRTSGEDCRNPLRSNLKLAKNKGKLQINPSLFSA